MKMYFILCLLSAAFDVTARDSHYWEGFGKWWCDQCLLVPSEWWLKLGCTIEYP